MAISSLFFIYFFGMAYAIFRKTFLPLLRTFYQEVEGEKNIPPQGPYIIAVNHVGFIDYFFIVTVFCRYTSGLIHFIAKELKFRDVFLRRWWGQIPVDPNDKEKCLKEAEQCLQRGEVVVFFPEGQASGNGPELYKGKTGVARLALRTKIPVLPVSFYGPQRLGKYFLSVRNLINLFSFFKKVKMTIGQPLRFVDYYSRAEDRDAQKQVLDIIMNKIALLSGKKYNF